MSVARLWLAIGCIPAVGGLLAQEFTAVAAPAQAPPAAVVLAPGRTLQLWADQLWIVDRAGTSPVPCTDDAGPGPVRALARAPAGTVFVAAGRGLFALDADHVVLDRIDSRDGVPAGAPTGLCCDVVGRLWVCTATAFGVVDPRFGFGRTFAAGDDLPAPPYDALVLADDGRLLLGARDGWFAYQPDVGPPPRRRDDGPQRFSATASSDGELRFTVDVEARGGATMRQRRRHHHLLAPADSGLVRDLRPGRHTVELHAVDRDLRRTVVAVADVEVPLPKAFDTRFLPLAAAAAGALLFAAAFTATRGRRRVRRGLRRTLLAGAVGLQLVAALLGYGRSWPFVGFSMYTENWHLGDVLHRPRLTALFADGSRRPLGIDEFGIMQDGYWQMLAEVVHGGDDERRSLWRGIKAHLRPGSPPLAGFVLADGRIRLTAAGPVDVAPTVLVEWLAP